MTAPVYIRVLRTEGYEDVCSELVVSDFCEPSPHRRAWPYEDATGYVERLEAALVGLVTGGFEQEREAYRLGREIAGRKP